MNTLTMRPQSRDAVKSEVSPFIQAFDPIERVGAEDHQPSWLLPLRKAGLARFAELGFPTTKHEDWRFTNVAPIAALPFQPVLTPPTRPLTATDLAMAGFSEVAGDRLVFLDGHFVPSLSQIVSHEPGVIVGSLRDALANQASLVQPHLARYATASENAFLALNDAYFTDGAFIHVPDGRSVEQPVQLLFIASGAGTGVASHPRNLVWAGRDSRLTVIEHYVGLADAASLTNSVAEWIIGDHAVVEHVRLQEERPGAFHVGNLALEIGSHASLQTHSFAFGARLSRLNLHTRLAGPHLECVLNGLYVVGAEQLADHYMLVEHAQPSCASHEYFNGILAGRAKGVFHGRILVRPGAQKTDAKQTNKNILLSNEATVDTKPQLEIYADDVKCTHGATIGQMNPESVFYLRSRGIPHETARRMLVHAFAGEILDRIRCAPLRESLDRRVWDRLAELDPVPAAQCPN